MPPLYLSRLTLNPLRRETQRDLADCHNMHRRMLSAFPDLPNVQQARERFGVLYRVEQAREHVTVLVQSREQPDWSRLPEGYLRAPAQVKPLTALYEHLQPSMELHFRLHANPTRRIGDRNTREAERWRGKRVNLTRESDQFDWLRRKGDASGFTLLTIRAHAAGLPDLSAASSGNAAAIASIPDTRALPIAAGSAGRRAGTGALTFGAVQFDGRLRITDIDRFRAALEQGIGSGKAYGFGLLSIAPIAPIASSALD